MEDGQSRRSLSPYHEKCFPPYCDSALQVDKTMVSKMPRGDLEDKYITFADENLELKKQNRNQEQQIQRLQTAIKRQDKLDKRTGATPTSMVADGNKVAILEAQNKHLQAKIKVLKQQLLNHSYIHSHENRVSDTKRPLPGKTPRESEFQIPSHTQSAREAKPDRNTVALKMQVAELENQLETQKNKYKNRIAQLEKELSSLEKEVAKSGTSVNEQLSETSRQVKDNTELIKLRMQEEKQAVELEELRGKLAVSEEEIAKLQEELKNVKKNTDELGEQLEKEKDKTKSVMSAASKGSTHLETIRALEEQIRDLQKERDTLKDTNDKLLQLTQTKSEKIPSGHSLQISQLEKDLKDKLDELEEKEARIKELEGLLEQAKKEGKALEGSDCKTDCPNCCDLSKKLCSALLENGKLKSLLESAQKPMPVTSETNLLKDEVQALKDVIDNLKKEIEKLKADKLGLENNVDDLENRLADANNELKKLRPIADEHEVCRKTPLPIVSSKDDALRKQNQLFEDALNQANEELALLRPIAEEHKSCTHHVGPRTSTKSVQIPVAVPSRVSSVQIPVAVPSRVSFKDKIKLSSPVTPIPSEESVHSKRTIESERYLSLRRQLEEALVENEKLKKELEGRDDDDALKLQNQRLENELRRALGELKEVRPIAEEHLHQCCQHPVEPAKETSLHSYHSKAKSLAPSLHLGQGAPSRPDYVSHVSPAPSLHCAKTMDVNDNEQKANLLIVSKHDFERVLMQKKRYSTEVEVVEPVDGRQALNCKLEICMYDLDIDEKMMEYLMSIQPEPKVYVEWSFVGLDQRTAPMPAEQALFYTNVMYYGPLSSEIKNYLNKVEMPVDLYLVRSSAAPLLVAQGTLDMLPAMEQPNRGFMRSVYLRGKDLPNKYNSTKPVATIHSSFILHECCLGDPPFKDQIEVAIGTLYLKNRDGGVVPDHATHIYIEYALLGHCGPDLETDSVPRGEVMKFNHSKKLRVNDENASHLKAMLEDQNPRPLRFTVLAEPCSLTSDTEVETVGHADINLNEEMIRKDRDIISNQVPVYSTDGEHLGSLSVTVLGITTMQQVYTEGRV